MPTEFLELLNRDAAALATRYAWHDFPEELYDIVGPDGDRCFTHGRTRHGDENVEWVHVGKVSPDLLNGLVEARLGIPNANRMWIALHPRLGAVYLSALADQVARANDMPVVTDQDHSYGTLNGWSLDTLADVLLGDEVEMPEPDRPEGEIASLYAAIAIKAVVPAGIEALPAEKIVEIRHSARVSAPPAVLSIRPAFASRLAGRPAPLPHRHSHAQLFPRLRGA